MTARDFGYLSVLEKVVARLERINSNFGRSSTVAKVIIKQHHMKSFVEGRINQWRKHWLGKLPQLLQSFRSHPPLGTNQQPLALRQDCPLLVITLKDQEVTSHLLPIKSFTFFFKINYKFMCISEYGFVHLSVGACWGLREGVMSPGPGLTGVCQLSNVDTNCEELVVRN